ncbi:MAG: TatD family hydrolase [Candidatus Marinimicrobia bacterium]|nr:TatD family hydrolase [Candidatus Neomarinimicrobiota bacterium]
MFIDTHAHLHFHNLYSQLDDVIQRAAENGIDKIICVGIDIESTKRCIAIVEKYPIVFAAAGIHPHNSKDAPEDFLDEIGKLVNHPKVVAIGETGLDFYRDLSPRPIQIDVFTQQLQLAKKLDLPVIVHNRNADREILNVVESVGHEKGVVHCFSSDVEMAKKVLELGFKISFTGSITFGNKAVMSVIKIVPLEDIMLETDCPFLAPVPKRGKLNEPANLPHIAARIAEIKSESVEKVAAITTANATNFFNLPA